jgi:phage shock protein PspC (stress-responsive transcriptional regulator)
MQSKQPSLLTRDDTFFGVCEGLGEDLGIHSNFLRLALTGLLFWNPPAAAAAYAGAGMLVLISRLLVPNPRPAAALEPDGASAAETAAEPRQANDSAAEPMPLAA